MMSTHNAPESAPPAVQDRGGPDGGGRAPVLPRISSRTVLGSEKEIEIDHEGVIYRLRVTALGKLILTK